MRLEFPPARASQPGPRPCRLSRGPGPSDPNCSARSLVKSRSDAQLRGEDSGLSECPPQKYLNGNESLEIFPCGLAAWSYFNDTYNFRWRNNTAINISTQDIAWASDKQFRFSSKAAPKNFNTDPRTRGGANITASTLAQDERFINWMRTSALSTFRKLWARRAPTHPTPPHGGASSLLPRAPARSCRLALSAARGVPSPFLLLRSGQD